MGKNKSGNVLYTYGMLITGVILGSLILLIGVACGQQYWLDCGLEEYDVAVLFNAPETKIMLHIIRKRVIQLFIFMLLSILTSYSVSSIVFCGSFGVYYGIVICNLILKYNLYGLLYGVTCFFPHFLIYLFMIYIVGVWRGNVSFGTRNYYGNVTKVQNGVKIIVIFLMFVAAVIWEIHFQKNFLNYFFQHLV